MIDTVIIFGAGETPPHSILDGLPRAELVVAANGGYDVATRLGVSVDVIVGDLDSIATVPESITVEEHPEDKDATDLELALEHAVKLQPRRIVVVGGTGGRHDHELALATLLTASKWSAVEEIDWISARGRAHVIRGHRIIQGQRGSLLSLIPMHGPASGVVTTGLAWNLNGDYLDPGTTRGVSNRFDSNQAGISVDGGVVLVVLPLEEV